MGTPATPDRDFVRNLVNIISHGANLGYQGPRKFSIAANLTSAFEHPEAIDAQIAKECDKGHLSAPLGSSVNCGIDPESYSLVYSTLQNACFFRRLINLSTKARRLHHYLHLNAASRMDILWWRDFLPLWNGRAPILDTVWSSANSLQLYTDASAMLGFGAYFHGAWFCAPWKPKQDHKPQDSRHWLQMQRRP